MKGEAVLYSIAGIGLTLLFFLSAHWLGPVGAFTNMLTALPACYLVMRFGLRVGLSVVVISTVALWQLLDLATLMSYLGLFIVPSLLLPRLLQRGMNWDRALLISGATTLLVAATLILTYVQLSGQQLSVLVDRYLQSEIDAAMQAYSAAEFTADQLANLKEVAAQVADFIRNTFVGLYAAGVLLVHLVTLFVLQRLKREHYQIYGVGFSQWRLPAMLIWLLIVTGFTLLAPLPELVLAGRNLLAVLLPLYFMQGLSVVSCFMQRKSWSPAVKGMVYLLVFILNPLPLVVTGVGVFDLWVDFRRPRKKDL